MPLSWVHTINENTIFSYCRETAIFLYISIWEKCFGRFYSIRESIVHSSFWYCNLKLINTSQSWCTQKFWWIFYRRARCRNHVWYAFLSVCASSIFVLHIYSFHDSPCSVSGIFEEFHMHWNFQLFVMSSDQFVIFVKSKSRTKAYQTLCKSFIVYDGKS